MKALFSVVMLGVSLMFVGNAGAGELLLTSPAFEEGQTIPLRHVKCGGDDISPALVWQGVPAGTRSLALTVYDPDAPTGSGWWHWLVLDLQPGLAGLPEGAGSADGSRLPAGAAQGPTDYGTPGYGGPCPPEGDKPHRYIFTLFALSEQVPPGARASAAMIGFHLNRLTLARTSLTGYFGR